MSGKPANGAVEAPPVEHQHANGGEEEEEVDFTDSADEWDLPVHGSDDEEHVNVNDNGIGAGSKLPQHLSGLEKELRGDAVPITFHIPAEPTLTATFYMGQTIEYLKAFLEQQKPRELPYNRTKLYLGDRVLIDPLSLSDLPFKAGENNDVKVTLSES